MGQANARQRLQMIKENVDEITEKIKSDDLTSDDRSRSHDILLDYIKELNFILSKSLRASRIRKVEKLIIGALEELATLEAGLKNVEPRLKAKSMQTLHDIEKSMKTINATITNQNLESEKENLKKYKKRISLIEDIDQEVGVTKHQVLNVVYTVENTFNELETEERVKQAEERHYQGRLDLSRFVGVSESSCYKKHREYLLGLKKEIDDIPDVSDRIIDKKKYLLFNIDNNLAALDKRVKENEDGIRKKLMVEEDIYALEKVLRSYSDFEKCFSANCTLQELREVYRQLGDLKIKVDQKLKILEHQILIEDVDPYIQLVPVKETDEDVVDTLVEPLTYKLEEIQKSVSDLQDQIQSSNTQTHTYINCKKKLEDYRLELEDLSIKSQEEKDLASSIHKQIDDVSVMLETDLRDRKSTTGDILIDIMSISTEVNELGKNLQSVTSEQQLKSIERDLLENLYHLRRLEIPSARSNVCKFRDYVLLQIDSYLSNLGKMRRQATPAEAKNVEMLSF